MADAGVASRRDCEAMISRGEVKVNGKVVTDLPVFINPRTDSVAVNGKKIEIDGGGGSSRGRGRSEVRRVYIAVNKPDRTLATTKDDPYGTGEPDAVRGSRRTVLDLVAGSNLGRLFPVGRLGFHDTGLVILTNDGELANRLTHARYGVPRTYVVFVRGRVSDDVLARMRVRLAASLGPDHPIAAEPLKVLSVQGNETELEVTLRESPKLRIDALIFDAGLKVKRLVRTAIGPVSIRGIASGNWRFLNRNDLEALMAAAGLGGEPGSGRAATPPRAGTGARPTAARASAGSRPGPRPKTGDNTAGTAKGPRRILPARSADQGGRVKR
jgi:23S rRNA pseudouridine2605 synthase